MYGELSARFKVGLGGSTFALILAIVMPVAVALQREQKIQAQEEGSIIRFEARVPPFIGPYVILTKRYFGRAAADGTVGVVRRLLIKAKELTPNSDAWSDLFFSLPGENPTGCLQVFGTVELPGETVSLDFSVCDPSVWDASTWLKWGIALLVVGGLVSPWVAGAIVIFTVGALIS